MRLHSTAESIKAGEFTWLAVAECVLSSALYLGIALHSHTLHYYALAIALAPLALLRTEAATVWALKKYENVNAAGQRLLLEKRSVKPVFAIALILFIFAITIAWGFIYRIVAVAYWFFRQPLEALRQMPRNWLRQTLCIDFYAPPEIVPGEDSYKMVWEWEVAPGQIKRFEHSELLTFRRVFFPKSFRLKQPWDREAEAEAVEWKMKLLLFVIILVLFAPAYLVPLLYRISMKATCVVYAPFVWVAGATAGSSDSLKVRLERIAKGEFERSRRRFAKLVLLVAAVKVALNLGWIGSGEAAHQVLFESVKLVQRFLSPESWPWWQLALVCDALVTFGLFWGADAVLSRMNAREGHQPRGATDIIAAVTFLRAASAVAVIAYLVAVAVVAVVPDFRR